MKTSQPAREVRVFVAHSKAHDEARLADIREQIHVALTKEAGGRATVVTILGRDDYMKHFTRCGSWDAWAQDVGRGIQPVTREPRYNAIVLVDQVLGKATAQIAEHALAANKAVLFWAPPDRFVRVSRIVERDAKDFKGGWYWIG